MHNTHKRISPNNPEPSAHQTTCTKNPLRIIHFLMHMQSHKNHPQECYSKLMYINIPDT